jgi:serine O-acetyltransferase
MVTTISPREPNINQLTQPMKPMSEIQKKPSYALTEEALRSDLKRAAGKVSPVSAVKHFLFDRCYRALVFMRLCQSASQIKHSFLRPIVLTPWRILFTATAGAAGMDISWKTVIGSGLRIQHGYGLVINYNAVIGRNVTLFHGVTIGAKEEPTDHGLAVNCPTIEDEVWIGAHAVIIGNVRVGKGSIIAPGSIVTKDVEPYTTVAGNPAKLLKYNIKPDVPNRAPLD